MGRIKVTAQRRRTKNCWVLVWDDGTTVKPRERVVHARNEREAWLAAADLENELNQVVPEIDWDTAVEDYEEFHLQFLSKSQQVAFRSARRRLEAFLGDMPPLGDLSSRMLDQWLKDVMQTASVETARAYWRFIRAMLNWCVDNERLERCPRVRLPRRKAGESKSRGRPLNEEEFERMLMACEKVVGARHAASWQYLIRGLWASSLRLGEAIKLHWEEPPVRISLSGRHPMIVFDEQKNGNRQRYPITPEFWELLQEQRNQVGYVFCPSLERGGYTRNRDTWCDKISDIGKRAGILLENGKHATAHDLRRSFMTRWRDKVDTATLRLLARHKSIETTNSYYLGDAEADIVAEQIWREV